VDIEVPEPVRDVISDVLVQALLSLPGPPAWSPLLSQGPAPVERPRECYALASGAMVHVRPGCRC
jgi:hypothetical protein